MLAAAPAINMRKTTSIRSDQFAVFFVGCFLFSFDFPDKVGFELVEGPFCEVALADDLSGAAGLSLVILAFS